MPFFVAPLKNLSFMLNSKTKVEAEVTFRDKEGDRPVGKVVVPESSFIAVAAPTQAAREQGQGFAAKYTWTAPGLQPGKREMDVLMEHNRQASGAKPTPIKVFSDTLQVKVVQAGVDGAVVGCSNVAVKLSATADPAWLDYTRKTAPAPKLGTTDDAGAVVFDGLPYGTFKAEVVTPGMVLDGPITETPELWTLKVKARAVAKLVYPAPLAQGAAPHKQWVNLDAVKANLPDEAVKPTYGSLVKVKVRAEIGGVAAADHHVWLGVLFNAANSKRTGEPRPGLTGAVEQGGLKIASAKTLADGVATFELELGAAGGDEVQLFVSGGAELTDKQHDQASALVSWRKLELVLVDVGVADGALEAKLRSATPDIPQASRQKVDSELAKAFVETLWRPARERLACSHPPVAVIEGDNAEAMGLSRTKKHLLWTSSEGPDKHPGMFPGVGPAFYPPRVFIIPVDKFIYESTLASWSFDLDDDPSSIPYASAGAKRDLKKAANIRASIPLPSPGGGFLQKDWNGESTVRPWRGKPSYWQVEGETVEHPITFENLVIVPDSQNSKCNLKAGADRPSTSKRASVFLKVQLYNGLAGSASGNRIALACGEGHQTLDDKGRPDPKVQKKIADRPLKIAYALLHEIGHAIGIALKNPAGSGYGPERDNAQHYVRAVNDGNHCSHGVDDPSAKPWDVAIPTVSGTCALYSPVHEATPYAQATNYCPTCLAHVKAANFGMHKKKSDLGGTRE